MAAPITAHTPIASPVAAAPAPDPKLVHQDAAKLDLGALVGGDQGDLRVEELKNGAHLIIAERPGAKNVLFQLGVAAGSLQDPEGKLGAAHLLEHMAFEGSSRRTGDQQETLRTKLGGMWNAYTTDDRVVYYGMAPVKQAGKAVGLLTEMYRDPALESADIKQEKAAVKNEMIYRAGSAADVQWHLESRLTYGDQPLTNNVIGSRTTIDRIEPKDLRQLHEQYYTGRNTVALVEGPPDGIPLDRIRRELEKLPAGSRVNNADLGQGFAPGQAVQIVKDAGDSSVNLSVSLPFDDSAVSTPQAIGPFLSQLNDVLGDRLRRIDHATYGAGASIEPGPGGDVGALTVRTTVPRAKAREALTRIVDTLDDARDGFGPKRFDTVKKSVASRISMDEPKEPTISEQAQKRFDKLISDPTADKPSLVDMLAEVMGPRASADAMKKVGYEDVAKLGADLINLDNLKVLATGNVGDGRDIRGGLKDAGVDLKSVSQNPVDMTLYRQMGLRVAKGEN